MNGMKLGTKQKPKNSFIYQNQFLNYEQNKKSESDYDQDDDQFYSQSRDAQSRNLSSKNNSNVQKNNNKLQEKPKQQNNKSNRVQKNESIASKKLDDKKVDVDQRISKLNQGLSRLNVSIHEMKNNYEDLQFKQKIFSKRNEAKQSQIKQFLTKKKQQKQMIQEKKRKQQQKVRQKLEQSIKFQQQQKANKSRNKIQQHLKRLGQMKERRQQQKQKGEQQKKLVSQLFEKLNNEQKKFHVRKLQQDNIKKQQQLKKRMQILAERKQRYKSIDFSQLQIHQKKHQQALQQLKQNKRQKRLSYNQKIQQENERLNILYRGQSHDYIEDQLQQKRLKREAPKQKINKIKQYQQYVRQNYLPKTHQPSHKKSQSNRSSLSNRQIKRYRYLNGVSLGQIVEPRIQPKSNFQLKQIGNNNLAYLRSLPKKKKQTIQPELSMEDIAILDKKLNSIQKVKRQANPLYQRSRHNTIQVKISEKPTRDQVNMVFQQLKSRDQHTRMKEKLIRYQQNNAGDLTYKHKVINDQIVRNIQQKLNLLSKI